MKKQSKFGVGEALLLFTLVVATPICAFLLLPTEQEQYAMLLRDGKYADAVEALHKLVDKGDRRSFILISLAKAYEGSNDAKSAANIMAEYVKKYPDDPAGFQLLSDLYAKANMPEEMTIALAKKFAINPTKDDFLRLVALYNTFGQYENERNFLHSSFKTYDFLQVPQLFRLGELLAAAGEYPDAIEVLSQLDRKLAPEQENGRMLLFDLLMENKRTEEAVFRVKRWIRGWAQPWLGLRVLDTLSLTDTANLKIGDVATGLAETHPAMRIPIARLLKRNGHVSIARQLLNITGLKRRFEESLIPDYDVSLTLLEAADALDDETLRWWLFAKSLKKPDAIKAQSLFADEISTRDGVNAILPFLDRMPNHISPLNPFLSARLALRTKHRYLAGKILEEVNPELVAPSKKATLTLLKTGALE